MTNQTIQLTTPSVSNPLYTGWDIALDVNGNIKIASPPYALAQDAASECRLFAGEAYYQTNRGIPYWGQVLGLAPPLALVRAYLVRAAMLVPGAVKAQAYFTSFTGRKLSGQVQVTTRLATRSRRGSELTAVPQPTFGAQGFQPPSEDDILVGVTEDLNAAFGGNLNPSPATPQGQLATTITAAIGNVNSLFLLYTNLVDPALNYGRMQDAIGRIYFIERIPSAPTVVEVTCTGIPNVPIPAGSQIQDVNQYLYVSTGAGTIGANGTVVIPFANQLPGPVPCSAGALNSVSGAQIYRAIPGWDAINNPSAGLLGNNVESPAAFEARRSASVSLNALGSLPNILGAVLAVPGVIDAYVYENATNSIQVVGGVSLTPNSIYVCVLGGAASDVAFAIWSRKAPGCAYNGNTTVTVLDQSAGYIPPYPAYQVTFQIPNVLPIVMAISLASTPLVPNNAVSLVQNAIVGAFAGLDGGQRAKIGSELFASRFYSTLAALGPWVRIVSILLGSTNSPGSSFSGSISGTTLTVGTVNSGTLAAGQTLFDAAGLVLPGTTITGQLSGTTGGLGTYLVNYPQTLSIESLTGVSPTLFDVSVNLDQIPSISSASIAVTFT